MLVVVSFCTWNISSANLFLDFSSADCLGNKTKKIHLKMRKGPFGVFHFQDCTNKTQMCLNHNLCNNFIPEIKAKLPYIALSSQDHGYGSRLNLVDSWSYLKSKLSGIVQKCPIPMCYIQLKSFRKCFKFQGAEKTHGKYLFWRLIQVSALKEIHGTSSPLWPQVLS